MESSEIKIAALGRPFTLGMLYDARRDQLIPGLTLWNDPTAKVKVTGHENSNFHISKSDSTDAKSSLLDVNASLKCSFLGGLVEVGGSARYLNDKKKSNRQSRVTLQYKTTTNFKQLSLKVEDLDSKQLDLIKKGSATHVVTGILYGANAFFVFDSEKVESSSVQEIEGSMEAAIKKIPLFSIEAKAEIKMTEEEKAMTDKFSCKFYGDFILKSNPATFEDAVKTYVELPGLLKEDSEKSVPMTVWLMPLKHFDPKAPDLKSEISVGLVRKVEDALENLREAEKRCNDSLDTDVAENFPHIREDLNRFQKLCGYYEAGLQKIMKDKLPLIRAGEEDEKSLENYLEDRKSSPFSNRALTKWMDEKDREITVIGACSRSLLGMKFVQSKSELDREVFASGVEDALCLVFTYPEGGDPVLDEMENYFNQVQVLQGLWVDSAEAIDKTREKAKEFYNIAKLLKSNRKFCFIVADLPNDKYKGATIYHYKKGHLVTEDFSKPAVPDVETITNREALIWYACDLTLDPKTPHNVLVLTDGNKKVTRRGWPKQLQYPNNPERFSYHGLVLCKESLKGRHYWEVEISADQSCYIGIAVAYEGVGRKDDSSEFNFNTKSWALTKQPSEMMVKHNRSELWKTTWPNTDSLRIGVFLDWLAGTLSYYQVSSNTLSHIYTNRVKFTEPLYPGFALHRDGSYAILNPSE